MVFQIADDFRAAARVAAELIVGDAVRRGWELESACAGMTTGGLAHHLADQTSNAIRLLGAPPSDQEPITVEEHYRRAAWVRSTLDEEPNVGIKDSANDAAAGGPDALVARVNADLAALPRILEGTDEGSPVLIPWQGWTLTAHDFLVTRLMEIVVHTDDLAASLDVPTPRFPDGAVREVLALLTAVAVERHGQTALVRALSRPQRAPASISAF